MASTEITFSRRTDYTAWIDGSRDRFGAAYFISTSARNSQVVLYRNERPYAANVEIARLDSEPATWSEVEAAISGVDISAASPALRAALAAAELLTSAELKTLSDAIYSRRDGV